MAKENKIFCCFVVYLLTLCSGFQEHDSFVNEFHINARSSQMNMEVDEVHIIFMNHLDVGYNGISPTTGFINNVLNAYFNTYILRALVLHNELISGGYLETFTWTTHPWIVYMFLNCPENFTLSGVTLKCPSPSQNSLFLRALEDDFITYHAGPMNMQLENMNELLFEMSLNISENLDQRLGKKRKFRVLSQRDVPGMSSAVIPTLVKKGIKGVSVGVNSGTSPPAVPKIFRWQFDPNNEVVAMWHPGGYPNNPGPNPAKPGGLSVDDCVIIENFPKALCFAFRTDNSGPPVNVTEVLSNYEIVRANFPNAKLHASTFEAFLEAVQPVVDQLPVVTGEIGDTWISGIGSDPRKMAEYRVVVDTLTECIQAGKCNASETRIQTSVNYLVKLAEHTWGLPSVGDTVNWTNADFREARSGQNYKNCELSWSEQREFTNFAVKQLGNHPVVKDIKDNLQKLNTDGPDLRGFVEVDRSGIYSALDDFSIGFSEDGSIKHLHDPYTVINWTIPGGSFGKFIYRTYDEADFNATNELYHYNWWIFTKPNLTLHGHPKSMEWKTNLTTLYRWEGNDLVLILKINMVDPQAYISYGAPRELWIQYVYYPPDESRNPSLDVTFWWKGKTTTRLPESLMYYFEPHPSPADKYEWILSKLGKLIDPASVIQNGSQYLHAIDSNGIYLRKPSGNGLQLISQDVPLVSVGTKTREPSPFPTPLQPIHREDITGMAFHMYNNMWDTNYILWYPYLKGDEDFKARFKIIFIDNDSATS